MLKKLAWDRPIAIFSATMYGMPLSAEPAPNITGEMVRATNTASRMPARAKTGAWPPFGIEIAYRKANLFPEGSSTRRSQAESIQRFCAENTAQAVFQAFREVERRTAGGFTQVDYGTDLMRSAFKPADEKNPVITPGPPTDPALPIAEQQAMANRFAGAIGLYKNQQSHRNIPAEAVEAAEVIEFASQLLRIVNRLA